MIWTKNYFYCRNNRQNNSFSFIGPSCAHDITFYYYQLYENKAITSIFKRNKCIDKASVQFILYTNIVIIFFDFIIKYIIKKKRVLL